MLYLLRKVLIGYAAYFFIADNIAYGKRKLLSLAQLYGIAAEVFQPYFRPLGVQHNRNRQVEFLSNLLDTVDTDLVLFMRTVRKIKAAYVEPCLK